MKLGILLSGGKDSVYAAYLAKKAGHELACAISIVSENPHSFMFHTPSIEKTKRQAEEMGMPIILQVTKGEKEVELEDLKIAIQKAKDEFGIEGVVTGAVESVYQATRVEKITNEMKIECFNPLWQKDQTELLKDLIKEKFEVIITGVFAYPLDSRWLGRVVDKNFIEETNILQKEMGINPAGEGGEFETFVLNCPLFKKGLKIKDKKIEGESYSWKMEVELE